MFGKFKGYKTYITATLAAIGAVAGYFVGDLQIAEASQLILTAILGVTVRHGIKNDSTK